MVNSLDIILGLMFSGKTSRLLEITQKINQENEQENDSNLVFILKPDIDNRYETSDKESHIISHNGLKQKCYMVNNLIKFKSNIEQICKLNLKTNTKNVWIIIDEGQFFENLRIFCEKMFDTIGRNINVKIVVSGLDGDFQNNQIGEILSLIPICDSVVKLKGKCDFCDKESIMSKRISNDQSQVLVGGNDLYKPTCREHHSLRFSLNEVTVCP